MKAVILDGSDLQDAAAVRILAAVQGELARRGYEVEAITIRDKKIAPCCGEFMCWVRSPGICIMDDDNRAIAKTMMAAGLLVYLSPVVFGGYSSILKQFVDHQIQNITPFFRKIDGEVHHVPRYDRYPDLLALGWSAKENPEAEAVFHRLVARNAINLCAKNHASFVVDTGLSDSGLEGAARGWLDAVEVGPGSPAAGTEARPEPKAAGLPVRSGIAGEVLGSGKPGRASGPGSIRKALLLVGSPRTARSTSNALGTYLLGVLAASSIQTETLFLSKAVRTAAGMAELHAAVAAADLVLLAFPLYVDTLPAPVIRALEAVAAHRKSAADRKSAAKDTKLFAAIANCGFPEAVHNQEALEVCRVFARDAGFIWAGGLALGCGGMFGGASLEQAGGRGIMARKALTMAAEALSRAETIPESAIRLLAKQVIPSWLYTSLGAMGWHQQARKLGTRISLRRAPYREGVVYAE